MQGFEDYLQQKLFKIKFPSILLALSFSYMVTCNYGMEERTCGAAFSSV